jgi:hypothetical protein
MQQQEPIYNKAGYFFTNYFEQTNVNSDEDQKQEQQVDFFKSFKNEHQVQKLTESNKEGFAFRKGVYMTDVTKGNEFKLLRCSTNLQGPTESFSQTDHHIMSKLNETAQTLFPNCAELNHVLAQIYYNHKTDDGKDKKAKISRHSDKTKDMPANGIMAFCTFYDSEQLNNTKKYKRIGNDVLYKNTSALTKLRFVLKEEIVQSNNPDHLPESFDLTLYPGSVFFMDLQTNRFYTHEIVPPNLSADDIVTRLGYVARCSNQHAKFMDGHTFIKNLQNEEWVPLRKATEEDAKLLKGLYAKENKSTDLIEYPFIDFSLNDGDYSEPILIKSEGLME